MYVHNYVCVSFFRSVIGKRGTPSKSDVQTKDSPVRKSPRLQSHNIHVHVGTPKRLDMN